MNLPPITGPILLVSHHHDPLTADLGYEVTSAYVEQFWLPTLGPTSTWLLRRLAGIHAVHARNDVVAVDLVELATDLGLSYNVGRSGPFLKALDRLIMFDAATRVDTDAIAIHSHLPQLPQRHAKRLSPANKSRLLEAHTKGSWTP